VPSNFIRPTPVPYQGGDKNYSGVTELVKNLQAISKRRAEQEHRKGQLKIAQDAANRQLRIDSDARAQLGFENRLVEATEMAKIKGMSAPDQEVPTIEVIKPDGSVMLVAAPYQKKVLDRLGQVTQAGSTAQMIQLPDDPAYGSFAGQVVPLSLATTMIGNNYRVTPERAAQIAFELHQKKRAFDVANPMPGTAASKQVWVWEFGTSDDSPGRMVMRHVDAVAAAPDGTYAKSTPTGKGSRLGTVLEIFGGPDSSNPASLWNAAKAMNKGKTGGFGRVGGVIGTKYRVWSGDEPFTRAYQDQLSGFASQIAKEFGESGRLSDQDILRTVKLFPVPGDTELETDIKLGQIWRVLEYARRAGQPRPDILGKEKIGWTQAALAEVEPPSRQVVGGAAEQVGGAAELLNEIDPNGPGAGFIPRQPTGRQ
jgi:hypothetical protein